MKGTCQDTTPILASFAGYRKKRSHQSHNRFTLALKAYSPKTLNAIYKGRFSITSLNIDSHFSTLDC